MKLLNPVLSLSAIFLLAPPLHSQEFYDPAGDSVTSSSPRVIRIYVEYYQVTTLELAEIMTEAKTGSDDSKLRAELLAKAKEGKATLLESHTVVSRSGERATTESITEYIYPTEYEISKPSDDKQKQVQSAIVVPTAFETRNLGATFEVEPILGEDGKNIDITFKPEVVYHVGESLWGQGPNSDVPFKMPTFYTLRVNTSVSISAGRFHFVSAHTPKDDKGVSDTTKKVIVLIKADVLEAGH